MDVVQAITVADNAVGASAAAFTITPTSSYIQVTCSDPDGCNATMDETGAVVGQSLEIINVSANVVNYADTAGVSEIAAAFAAGQWDSISMRYATSTWVETGRSNN